AVAEPGSVLVGDSTKHATEEAVVYEDVGARELKGKSEPVQLWRAVRVISGIGGAKRSAGLEAPFVGRDRELRVIKELFHASAGESRAQLASVMGVAGTGKSRLSWEFFKYIDGLAGNVRWHAGRCLPYGEGVTYWALAEMVRTRASIAEGEEPAAQREKLHLAVEQSIADPDERRFVEPRLAHLLGLEEHAPWERENLFSAWRLFYERLAEEMPTVMVFEDMEWADAALLDFIEHLVDWSKNHSLFVLVLARPELAERRPTWGAARRNFSSLYLEPLSTAEMETLLAGLVPGLPDDLRVRIRERAEGVPLYAVETVRMLLDRGLLVEDGSSYRLVGELESLEVPETLHALVAARLDGLSGEERRLLQDAAVLGKTFTAAGLGVLCGVEREPLERLLGLLVRKEVLGLQADPRSPEHGQYGFLQDILRHVAYETLPRRERRAKHLAAAEYLGGSLGEEEVAEVVAAHLLDAYRLDPDAADATQLRARAYGGLLRAGERASSLGASAEALHSFERAAELASGPFEQAAALGRAGEMALAVADERAGALFEQAIALYEAAGDTHAAARASGWVAVVEARGGRTAEAIERMERAYATIGGDEPDADLAFLLIRLGSAHFFAGDLERAGERVERGLDLAEALGLPDLLARGWNAKANLLSARRPEEARALYRLVLDTALAHELYQHASAACANLSNLGFGRDRYGDSLGHLEQARELALRSGDRTVEWFVLSELSYALTMLGRWDEALARFAELPDEQVGLTAELASPLLGVLEIHLQRGEPGRARRLLARYEDVGRSGDVQAQGAYQAALAAVRLADGDPQGALAAGGQAFAGRDTHGIGAQDVKHGFRLAVEAALSLGDRGRADELLTTVERLPPGLQPPYLTAQAQRFRARLAGDDPAGGAGYAAAAAGMRTLELPFHHAVVQLEHAEWLTVQERHDEAEPLLAEARDTFERLQAAPWLERLQRVAIESVAAPAQS
ncbi:MAG: ATP-binding protein, partial [Gaiellaceae bacterium]